MGGLDPERVAVPGAAAAGARMSRDVALSESSGMQRRTEQGPLQGAMAHEIYERMA